MKKMMTLGMIAAMTITAATMTVPTMAASQITETQAKEIALKDAGLKEDQVTFVQTKKDFDDGVTEFEVEFFSGNKEFDYDIDATTGAIRSKDFDCESSAPAATADAASSKFNGNITKEQALEIALKDANVLKKNTSFIQVKEEFDDGFQQFDVEFHVGLTEFNYDIDAKTGTILDSDIDIND